MISDLISDLDRPVLILRRGLRSDADDVVLTLAMGGLHLAATRGFAAVEPSEVRWLFESAARRDMAAVRLFAARANHLGLRLDRLDDSALAQTLTRLIDRRELVGMRGHAASGDASRGENRELVRQIDGLTRGAIGLRGQQYRVAVSAEVKAWLDRSHLRVLPHAAAERVLDELAQAPGTSRHLSELLSQARQKLAEDGRWAAQPDGLVVLQRQPAVAAARRAADGPTYTPSELKAWMDRQSRKTHSFELIAYDSFGRVLPGVRIALHVDGSERTLTTDGNGRVRYEGASNETATACVADLATVRELLASRRAAPPEHPDLEAIRGALPIDPHSPASPMQLAAEVPKRIVFRRRVVRVRLIGMYFDHAKSFLLPGAPEKLRKVVDVYREHPRANLLIVGHTDTRHAQTPDPATAQHFNRRLSMERARAVASYLTDDVDGWLRWYKVEGERRWGASEDLNMLARAATGGSPYYREGRDPKAAARRYQTDRGLPATGTIGEQTRRALIKDYMSADGTTLPRGIERTTHGCGPYFPDAPTGPNDDVPQNRRVEILVFDGPIVPPPPADYSEPGSPEYPAWVAQVDETIDLWLEDESCSAMGHFRPRPGAVADESELPGEEDETVADSTAYFRLRPGAAAEESELRPEEGDIDADAVADGWRASDLDWTSSPERAAESI